MKRRVEGNRFWNRLKYIFGDKDIHHWAGVADPYSTYRHNAEIAEQEAESVPTGLKGRMYEKAGKMWTKAKEDKRAAKNYNLSGKYWQELAYSQEKRHQLDAKFSQAQCERSYRNAKRLEKVGKGEWHGFEGRSSISDAITIIGLVGGLYLLSGNLTGNVISSVNSTANSTSNIIGAVLLVIGLIGSFYWFKSKRK